MTDIYQVDAFADTLFEGNPAAVVLLDEWPDDLLLQSIAAENNLAETAYLVASGNQWELRWFTPTVEVALCGHATLAAAHVLYNHLGSTPSSIWAGNYSPDQFDIVAVFDSSEEIAALIPNEPLFKNLGSRGIIATASAHDYDFVSRYFAPAFGVPEDPVTGSAHCLLTPFWADRLDKTALRARQISPRSGTLGCRVLGDRVELTGRAVDYLKGSLSF